MADAADDAQIIQEEELKHLLSTRTQLTEEPDEDDMGRYCLTCGVMIPPLRLQIVPQAVRCVDCQIIHEYKNKQVTK